MPTAALDCMKSSSFSSLTTYSHPKAKGQICISAASADDHSLCLPPWNHMQMASGWYRMTVILIWIQSLLIPCVAASFTTILLANVNFLPWTALQQKVSQSVNCWTASTVYITCFYHSKYWICGHLGLFQYLEITDIVWTMELAIWMKMSLWLTYQ